MKILFCAQVFESRFVGPAVLAEHLLLLNSAECTNEIRILTPDISETILEDNRKIYKLPISYPRFLRSLDFILLQAAYYRAVKDIRRTFKFDVLVFGDARFGGLTKIFSSNGTPVIGFVNDYMQLTKNWRTFELSKNFIIRFTWKQFEKLAVHKLDAILACSDFLKTQIIETYKPQNSLKIKRLYPGFDVQGLHFQVKSLFSFLRIRILFVKAFPQYGALDVLLKSLEKLSKQNDWQFELWLVGQPQADWQRLSELGNQLAPSVFLHFWGQQAAKNVHKLMHEADILCIPSRLEGLGIANAEGLAAGISVVSSLEGGIPEVLGNGAFGWLSETENVDSLAQALNDCLTADEAKRTEKSHLGRKFVEENFDFRQTNQQFLEICSQVFSNKTK
jgi:colanic acid/amylovoran biosynthesis glycosyltransferase